jgi:purine-binding chemotaxis protein CheW
MEAVKSADLSTTFVSFGIGREVYAVDVFKVSEVIQPREVTEVPDMPHYVLGVINLRGNVIPVVDLKKRLGAGETSISLNTRMIVIEKDAEEKRFIAILTDYVTDVISFDGKKLLNPPEMGTRIKHKFLHGMYETEDDNFVVILNIEAIIEADIDTNFIKDEEEVSEANEEESEETAESDEENNIFENTKEEGDQ